MLNFFSLIIMTIFCNSLFANSALKKVDIFAKNVKEAMLQEINIYNGKVKVIRLPIENKVKSVEVSCDNRKVPSRIIADSLELILIAGYYSPDREFFCETIYPEGKTKILKIKVNQFAYKETELTVAPGKVFLSAKDQQRVAKEQKLLNLVYNDRTHDLIYTEPFMIPLDSVRTGIYGDKRIFNKKQPSTHLGNDFRAPVGTAIPCTNKGKVVFVGDLFFSGKTVIIDHGMQLFSMYAHMSKIQVEKGAMLKKGDIVGLSGATGRVSGPHLHWGVKINGEWIDGFSLVEEYNALETKQ